MLRDYWGACTSLTYSVPRSTLRRLVYASLFLHLVFSSLPRRVRPIPRVHQRWLAASADNFPFMLVDVSRATRAREQLYTAIVSSRRRLSCSRPPERSLERTHIAHLFCPTQYSPTVGLRVLFLQKSSISSCLSLRSHRPIVPLVLVRLQRITKPSKVVTRLVFELFCSLFFFHIAYSPTSPACGARRIGRHTTHRFAWRLRLSLRWFERTRRTLRALLCLPAQYL